MLRAETKRHPPDQLAILRPLNPGPLQEDHEVQTRVKTASIRRFREHIQSSA